MRAAGLTVSPASVAEAVRALSQIDAASRNEVYWSCRLLLCSRHEDLERYDQVFRAYFDGGDVDGSISGAVVTASTVGLATYMLDQDWDGEPADLYMQMSARERLLTRDIASLDERERHELAELLAAFRYPWAPRRSRRYVRSTGGAIDRRRTTRQMLATAGEPVQLMRRRHAHRPRRLVLLLDISGSMSAYADVYLRFAHAASHSGVPSTETFTIGTRLTRITHALRHRDPHRALAEVAVAMPDWGGGTQLGALLERFIDEWGQRRAVRGAVVAIVSDGWEPEDPQRLGKQVERLGRLARRVVWANPHKGRPGYEPLVAGIVAVLPHLHAFVEGHSLASLEHLADVLAQLAGTTPLRVPTPSQPPHE